MNSKHQAKPTTERILEAAARIVETDGSGHLTIDAVALAAGLSKGGVLYHFPTKHALLEGMLSQLLADFQTRTEHYHQKTGQRKTGQGNSRARAWIQAEYEQSAAERSLAFAILANAAEDPSLLNPARTYVEQTFADIRASGGDEDFNLILVLAAEGLRFLNMMDMLPLDDVQRQSLHDRLLALAGESAS
jgi:AcrR family transcriptional regulator